MFQQLRSPVKTWFPLIFGPAVIMAGIACGSDDLVNQPTDGTILVVATTVGAEADLDPNGYTVSVSNGYRNPIAIVGTIYVEDLEPGDYEVGLTGMAPNCAAAGDNPLSVTVVPADTVSAEFDVTCQGSGPPDDGGENPVP